MDPPPPTLFSTSAHFGARCKWMLSSKCVVYMQALFLVPRTPSPGGGGGLAFSKLWVPTSDPPPPCPPGWGWVHSG